MYVEIKVFKYKSMKECDYALMQVWRYTYIQVCKYVRLQGKKCGSLQVSKYASRNLFFIASYRFDLREFFSGIFNHS